MILLDEFEKAHQQVSNLLLQVFDEGRLTDSQGKAVDFRNTVIILTSNLGANVMLKKDDAAKDAAADSSRNGIGQDSSDVNKDQIVVKDGSGNDDESSTGSTVKSVWSKEQRVMIDGIVNKHFSPEFINRLDETIIFNPLSPKAMHRICQIELQKVKSLLLDRSIELTVEGKLGVSVDHRPSIIHYTIYTIYHSL